MEIGGAKETRKQLTFLCNVWSGDGLPPIMPEHTKRNPRAHAVLVMILVINIITCYYCTLQ